MPIFNINPDIKKVKGLLLFEVLENPININLPRRIIKLLDQEIIIQSTC